MANVLSLLVLGFYTHVQGQTLFELWPDSTVPPPPELEILPTGELGFIDLGDQIVEKDGQTYKSVQLFSDREFEVTVPVGKYVLGFVGVLTPPETFDLVALLNVSRMVSVEINDQVIEIDDSYFAVIADFPFEGVNLGAYHVYPRFNEPGNYTLRYRWRQIEPFYFILPFGAPFSPEEDPAPEYEGRRAVVAEQIGDVIDGDMVLTYHVTVEETPTAVEADGWGAIKQEVVGSD